MNKSKMAKLLEIAKEEDIKIENKEIKEALKLGRRGGARPGAGRPAGKIYPTGRRNNAVISCKVPDEIKNDLERQANEAGLTQTEYLCSLIKVNSTVNI